jgi:peroxiredoxin
MQRNTVRIIGLLALVPIVALSCSHSGKASADRLNPGDAAPLFSLPMLDGNEEVVAAKVIYSAYATVLIFWSMTCPNCREALLECQEVYDEYGLHSTSFFGINYDTENTQGVRAFLKGEGVTIPHLWDRGQRTTKEYKALDYTFSVFVIDREGRIVLAQYDHPPDLVEMLSEAVQGTFPGSGD